MKGLGQVTMEHVWFDFPGQVHHTTNNQGFRFLQSLAMIHSLDFRGAKKTSLQSKSILIAHVIAYALRPHL